MENKSASATLELAFDVGHSSLGWAVLQSSPSPISHSLSPTLLGCGVVTFGADDCLASKRRLFRRQRRHARATRQRIGRLEKLLAHLGVMSAEQLAAKHQPAGGHSAPWLLAARVLASNGDAKHLLTCSPLASRSAPVGNGGVARRSPWKSSARRLPTPVGDDVRSL